MNVLSLFDGMSCGQIALNRCGIYYDNYYASEIDKYAIKVRQANYPNTIQLGSIVDVKASDLPKIYLLIGGSPCQGFSFAGKGLNFEDPRSNLFFEYVRLLKELQPKYFLLENVKMKKEHEDVISSFLCCKPLRINSALVSAQKRQRLYWTNIPVNSLPVDKGIMLKDIIEDGEVDRINYSNFSSSSNEKFRTERIKRNYKELDEKAFSLNATSFKGMQANGMTNINDGRTIRKLTPIECERLQTVPDNYTNHVSNTQRYKMLGNGWTIDVVAHIFKHIK